MPLKLYTQDNNLQEKQSLHSQIRHPRAQSEQLNLKKNHAQHDSKTQLQPTSAMPLGSSALTELKSDLVRTNSQIQNSHAQSLIIILNRKIEISNSIFGNVMMQCENTGFATTS